MQADNFQDVGKQVLVDFHDMVQSGVRQGWSLEEVSATPLERNPKLTTTVNPNSLLQAII
jgi:hypothetical protein